MNLVARIITYLLTIGGLALSVLLAPPPLEQTRDIGSFISPAGHHSQTHTLLPPWTCSFPGEEQPQEEDDDDDQTKDLPRFLSSTDLGFLKVRHFFDHPGFDQRFSQVTTPPPRQ